VQLIREGVMGWLLATKASLMKRAQLEKNADWRLFRGKLSTIFLAAFVLAMLAIMVLLVWQKSTQRLDTGDYDGTIVDRWADYSESVIGSRPRFNLLIESPDGKRFKVRIEANVYESAKVGMRIKSRSGQIVLIEVDQGKAP
jgi:hypothetical protein